MPRNYVRRGRSIVNPWTDAQKDRLERMALARQPWPDIAEACGHPKASCQSMMSYIRRQRRLSNGIEVAIKRRTRGVVALPPPAPSPEPTGRTRHTSTLQADAELRSRIEIQGANGLLGDPLPGRSALDRKRMAEGVSS